MITVERISSQHKNNDHHHHGHQREEVGQQLELPQLLNLKCCGVSITHLDLSYSYLKRIPRDVTSMKNLKTLDLSHNQINTVDSLLDPNDGFMSPSFASSSSSTSSSPSSSPLSSSSTKLDSLEAISLDFNEITMKNETLITLGNCFPSLTRLSIGYQSRKIHPSSSVEEITISSLSLPRLQYLNISGNNLVHLKRFTGNGQLKKLVIHSNRLSNIPTFSDCESLSILDISNNTIKTIENFQSLLKSLPNLCSLDFSGNSSSFQFKHLPVNGINGDRYKCMDLIKVEPYFDSCRIAFNNTFISKEISESCIFIHSLPPTKHYHSFNPLSSSFIQSHNNSITTDSSLTINPLLKGIKSVKEENQLLIGLIHGTSLASQLKKELPIIFQQEIGNDNLQNSLTSQLKELPIIFQQEIMNAGLESLISHQGKLISEPEKLINHSISDSIMNAINNPLSSKSSEDSISTNGLLSCFRHLNQLFASSSNDTNNLNFPSDLNIILCHVIVPAETKCVKVNIAYYGSKVSLNFLSNKKFIDRSLMIDTISPIVSGYMNVQNLTLENLEEKVTNSFNSLTEKTTKLINPVTTEVTLIDKSALLLLGIKAKHLNRGGESVYNCFHDDCIKFGDKPSLDTKLKKYSESIKSVSSSGDGDGHLVMAIQPNLESFSTDCDPSDFPEKFRSWDYILQENDRKEKIPLPLPGYRVTPDNSKLTKFPSSSSSSFEKENVNDDDVTCKLGGNFTDQESKAGRTNIENNRCQQKVNMVPRHDDPRTITNWRSNPIHKENNRSENLRNDSYRSEHLKGDSYRSEDLKSDSYRSENLKGDSYRSENLRSDKGLNDFTLQTIPVSPNYTTAIENSDASGSAQKVTYIQTFKI